MAAANRGRPPCSPARLSTNSSPRNRGGKCGPGRTAATSTRSAKKVDVSGVETQTARLMNAVHKVLDPKRGGQSPTRTLCLAVMTKAPRAGQVKTRLTPPLAPKEAAALNICFLRDTAAAISRRWDKAAPRAWCFHPEGSRAPSRRFYRLNSSSCCNAAMPLASGLLRRPKIFLRSASTLFA